MEDKCKESILAALADIQRTASALEIYKKEEQEVFATRTMEIAELLRAKRAEFKADRGPGSFKEYLELSGLDQVISHDDRAALINIGRYPDIAKNVLATTERRSWREIWGKVIKPLVDAPHQDTRRFSSAAKPTTPDPVAEVVPLITEPAPPNVTPQEEPASVIPIQKPIPPMPVDILERIDRHMKALQREFGEIEIIVRRFHKAIEPLALGELYNGLSQLSKDAKELTLDIKAIIPDTAGDPMPLCHVVEKVYSDFRKKLEQEQGGT